MRRHSRPTTAAIGPTEWRDTTTAETQWAGRPYRGLLRDHRGDGAAGGISGDGDAAEVSTDLAAMLGDPPRCGPSIFDGSGVGVLRRQPVVDGHDNRVSADGVLAAGAIVRVEVAHDESAAM